MKRAQKNFERDPTKKIFWSSKTLRGAKARNHEQSSLFNNKFKKTSKKKKKSREIWWNAPKKILSAIRAKNFFRVSETLHCESQKSRTKFVI